MAKSRAAFLQTRGLQSRPLRSGRPGAWAIPQRHDLLSSLGRFLRCAEAPRSLGSSRADAPTNVTHLKSPRRYVPCQNQGPESDSLACSHGAVHRPGYAGSRHVTPHRGVATVFHCSSGGIFPMRSLILSASWRLQIKSASGVRTSMKSWTPSKATAVPSCSKTMLLLESTAVMLWFAAFPYLSFSK